MIIILATHRPSHQVIDPSMRDLFGYRWAFRCTTDASSDTVLGQGWASEGYTAADIDPLARGVGWLLSETGMPRRIKAAYLTDDDIQYLAAYAARLRGKDTGRAIEPRAVSRRFDLRCAKAGVRRIRVHDTRRTCGSLLAALDVHPRVAMQVLRHSKISITMEIYTMVPDKATLAALKRLGDALSSPDAVLPDDAE